MFDKLKSKVCVARRSTWRRTELQCARKPRAASSGATVALWAAIGVVIFGAVSSASATQVRFFRANDRVSVQQGETHGVGVDALGTLHLTEAIERVGEVTEPFAFSAAAHPDGWVVGTGSDGRVLLVERSGEVRELFQAPEPEIFAVHVTERGEVFVGSSPNGKVYRIEDGEATEWFDPGQTYIWALDSRPSGELLVATGTEGRVFEVTAAGEGSELFVVNDAHARSLTVAPDGHALVGTAPSGLILRIAPDDSVRTLYDASLPEVVAFTCTRANDCYAALLDSEASLVPAPSNNGDDEGGEDGAQSDGGRVTVTVEEDAGKGRQGSRLRSAVVRVQPAGGVHWLWTFEKETVYDLLWREDRLWIATGQEGQLFSLDGADLTLERELEERQIVRLLEGEKGLSLVTTNAAGVFKTVEDAGREGRYTSPSLDAEELSEFGVFRWRGEQPRGSSIGFKFRTGMSAEPDVTWSDWSAPSSQEEISLADLPAGRFVQWEVEMKTEGGASPVVRETTLSFRQKNQPPRIESFEALAPGVVLVAGNFNASQQVYEPVHPNRDGVFTRLRPASADREDRRSKTVWKKGYRTLRWQAKDPNEDALEYRLEFRREEDSDDAGWMLIEEEFSESSYSFDASALPDGVYRFRLTATDAPGNLEGLESQELSGPLTVDHTPPTLEGVERRGDRLEVRVRDRTSPIVRAEVSLDAGGWIEAKTADSMVDGLSEIFVVDVPAGAEFVLLRVGDAAWNHVTYNLLEEAKSR